MHLPCHLSSGKPIRQHCLSLHSSSWHSLAFYWKFILTRSNKAKNFLPQDLTACNFCTIQVMDFISICKAANYLFNFQLVAFNIKKNSIETNKGCQSCWQKCCLFMMILHMSKNECHKDFLTCVEEK